MVSLDVALWHQALRDSQYSGLRKIPSNKTQLDTLSSVLQLVGLVRPQPLCRQMNNCPEHEPEQKHPVRFKAWYLVQTSTKCLAVLLQLCQAMHSRYVRDLDPGVVQTVCDAIQVRGLRKTVIQQFTCLTSSKPFP